MRRLNWTSVGLLHIGGDDQLQLLAWSELLSLAAGAVVDATSTVTGGSEPASSQTAAAQRKSAGWSGWDAAAAAGAASRPGAPAATAQLPGSTDHGATSAAAARGSAFAAFMSLLLEFFCWRSHVPDEPLASPPKSQVQ